VSQQERGKHPLLGGLQDKRDWPPADNGCVKESDHNLVVRENLRKIITTRPIDVKVGNINRKITRKVRSLQ